MHFFVSGLHGAASEYFLLKEKLELKKNDTLYILGDVLDGNNAYPEACLDILRDIMVNDNIHLLIGDHEYWHALCYLAKGTEDLPVFQACLKSFPDYTGTPLMKYMNSHLSAREYARYMRYLTEECEVSDCIEIGDRTFYLVHSSPAVCMDKQEWQQLVCETPLLLEKNYTREILSDPNLRKFLEKDGNLHPERAIIISGGMEVKEYADAIQSDVEGMYRKKKQRIIVKGDKMLINCGCAANSLGQIRDGWVSDLACVGIDAAGFFVTYLSELCKSQKENLESEEKREEDCQNHAVKAN